MNSYKEVFDKTFAEMPTSFNSTEFVNAARKHGITEAAIAQGNAANYLHRHCTKVQGHNVWVKNNGKTKQKPIELPFTSTVTPVTKTDEECIQQLKSKGYIIWKPSNYVEV